MVTSSLARPPRMPSVKAPAHVAVTILSDALAGLVDEALLACGALALRAPRGVRPNARAWIVDSSVPVEDLQRYVASSGGFVVHLGGLVGAGPRILPVDVGQRALLRDILARTLGGDPEAGLSVAPSEGEVACV